MTPQQPHRILVVANRTCPCPELIDEIARRDPDEVLVVAPALNSRLRHWVSDVDGAVAQARDRLAVALAGLRERGIGARGEVGDADPLLAIDDALAGFAASEILVSTRPPGQSNWLERGLIDKARARFAAPVVHLVPEGVTELDRARRRRSPARIPTGAAA